MAKTMTAVGAKKLRPGKQRREIPDGGCPGLYLIIQTSGRKSWALRFRRPNGKPGKLTLGPIDLSGKEAEGEPVIGTPLTLASARQLAAEVHRQRARGRDVIADHDTAKRRQRFEHAAQIANTFSAAARDFVEQHAMKKTRRWRITAQLLGLDPDNDLAIVDRGLADRWLDKPLVAIDADAIHNLVDEVRRLGVPGRKRRSERLTEGLARSMLSTLSALFGWLRQQRRVEDNPCAGLHRHQSDERDRVLSNAEITRFWQVTGNLPPVYGAALRLLLLTGCRREEVAGMRRSELSDDGATWTIPGSRTKNKKPHVVPLPPLAREIIAGIPINGDLVFSIGGAAPISAWVRIKKQLDVSMQVPAWVIHDLRRTAATGMAEINVQPHIVEACLNHVGGAKAGVAGIYNRAVYAPEKKAALERWATHIAGLVAGRQAEVVPLLRGSG